MFIKTEENEKVKLDNRNKQNSGDYIILSWVHAIATRQTLIMIIVCSLFLLKHLVGTFDLQFSVIYLFIYYYCTSFFLNCFHLFLSHFGALYVLLILFSFFDCTEGNSLHIAPVNIVRETVMKLNGDNWYMKTVSWKINWKCDRKNKINICWCLWKMKAMTKKKNESLLILLIVFNLFGLFIYGVCLIDFVSYCFYENAILFFGTVAKYYV